MTDTSADTPAGGRASSRHGFVEVKDKFFGGEEVEKDKVVEKGDKAHVPKTETDMDNEGNLTQQKTEIKGDKID